MPSQNNKFRITNQLNLSNLILILNVKILALSKFQFSPFDQFVGVNFQCKIIIITQHTKIDLHAKFKNSSFRRFSWAFMNQSVSQSLLLYAYYSTLLYLKQTSDKLARFRVKSETHSKSRGSSPQSRKKPKRADSIFGFFRLFILEWEQISFKNEQTLLLPITLLIVVVVFQCECIFSNHNNYCYVQNTHRLLAPLFFSSLILYTVLSHSSHQHQNRIPLGFGRFFFHSNCSNRSDLAVLPQKTKE